METERDPCTGNGAAWAIAGLLSKVDVGMAVFVQCLDTPVGANGSFEIYGQRVSAAGWQSLYKWTGPKTDLKIVARNTFLSSSGKPNSSFAIVHPTNEGYSLRSFDSDFRALGEEVFGPVDRSRLPIDVAPSEGTSSLALWLQSGLSLLPPKTTGVAVGKTSSNRTRVFYMKKDQIAGEVLCRAGEESSELCSSLEFSDGPFNWEFRKILISNNPEQELLYVLVPSSTPSTKWAMSIQGGPFYSSFQPQLGQAQTLSRLGYHVIVPFPTGGVHKWSHLPSLDPQSLDPELVGGELDALIRTVKSDFNGVSPIIASSSAGAAFAARLKEKVRGHLLVSPACFPLVTLESGFAFREPEVSRAEIKDDAGVAQRLADQSGNSCSGFKNGNSPLYGIGFNQDPTLGAEAVSKSAEFIGSLPNSSFNMVEGSKHTVSEFDQDVGIIERGMKALEKAAQ